MFQYICNPFRSKCTREKMISRLSDIAEIQSGVYAKTTGANDVAYVQARHFDENGTQIEPLLGEVRFGEVKARHVLEYGDVLFAAKGTKNFAVAVGKDWIPAVASTSYFVIRLRTSEVLPEYVAWYLNHPQQQQVLKGQARGTAISSIAKDALEDLEVPVPPLQKQHALLKIAGLRKMEANLTKRIEELREHYIQHLLLTTIQD